MMVRSLTFSILAIFSLFLLSACSADSGLTYEEEETLLYRSEDLGLKFEYPDYYGEPMLSQDDDLFYLRFLVEYEPDDPYLIYINGTKSTYASPNEFVRSPYKGDAKDLCGEVIGFINAQGEVCDEVGVGFVQNLAILDISSSIEQVFFANFPDEAEYDGLQMGFRIPSAFMDYSLFARGDVRGDSAVESLISRMDRGRLPKNLIDELERFRVVLESLEFIPTE